MSYASASDFLKRYDARVTGDLVGDIGNRATPTQLLADGNLQAALDDASGLINAAIFVGQRYLPTDLQLLSGVDQAFLIRLNCDLAYGLLRQRRGLDNETVTQFQLAMNILEMLRKGERIFAVPAVEADGNPTSEFPSVTTIANTNLMRDTCTPRFFPIRRTQVTTPGRI